MTLTAVALALTGFQTSSGSGSGTSKSSKSRSGKSRGGSTSGDSGGGCSHSRKRNDDYDSDDAGGGSQHATAAPTVEASPSKRFEVVVVDCVRPEQKKRGSKPARKADTTSTLRITSRESVAQTYAVILAFEDAQGARVDTAERVITVEAGETKTFEVAMRTPRAVDRVKDCRVSDARVRE
ncbi:hypothetical protein [Streptomyces sp. NPDC048577]|uniref:hypothetical protein n=1 Tax=Streptomyces sp. NPDC048577 TaxID=3157209 RepID=UPI003440DE3E